MHSLSRTWILMTDQWILFRNGEHGLTEISPVFTTAQDIENLLM
jgi:hypothetical protein